MLSQTLNKCVKYVPGLKALHRTAFAPLRCAKSAVYAGVISQGESPVHEHRNASNQLTFAFAEIPMSQYSKVTRQVVKEFDLAACGKRIRGLDEVFQDFGRGSTLIALEWDNWSGFMVCAKSKEAETLAGKIASYVQNL